MKIILPIMMTSLLGTLIVETVVAFIIGIRDKKDYINVILVNILTNPLVVSFSFAVNLLYGFKGRVISMIILEILAFFIEGLIYGKVLKYKKVNYFMVSLILNGTSYIIGYGINYLVW